MTAKWIDFSGPTICQATSTSTGNFSCTGLIPSSALAGAYPVFVSTSGGTGISAQVNVSGNPALSLSSSSGQASSKITIAGGGFKANSSVPITWDGAAWVTVTANSGGGFSYPATITPGPLGANTIGATGVAPSGSAVSVSATFTITRTGGDTGSRMTSNGTFAVTATIEGDGYDGLIGQGTSNGHIVTALDHFVALPSCTTTSCPTWYTGPTMTCGNACYVRVTNPATNKCSVAPVWDVGPWFTNDNWWDGAADRKLNAVSTNPNYLAQGYPGTVATYRDGLDVGYGPGTSNVRLKDGNYAAMDIAAGTWVDIGIDINAGIAPVVVSMLWMTGENYVTAMAGCGQSTGVPTIVPSSTTGIKVGTSLTINGVGFKSGETVSIRLDSSTAPVIGSVTASNAGVFSIAITVPPTTNGTHTIYATGGSGSKAATANDRDRRLDQGSDVDQGEEHNHRHGNGLQRRRIGGDPLGQRDDPDSGDRNGEFGRQLQRERHDRPGLLRNALRFRNRGDKRQSSGENVHRAERLAFEHVGRFIPNSHGHRNRIRGERSRRVQLARVGPRRVGHVGLAGHGHLPDSNEAGQWHGHRHGDRSQKRIDGHRQLHRDPERDAFRHDGISRRQDHGQRHRLEQLRAGHRLFQPHRRPERHALLHNHHDLAWSP